MNRREFVKGMIGAGAATLAATQFGGSIKAAAPAAKRPNILWLMAEDFGQHLGCYGTKEVWTPILDKLAADGVRYTRFFTTAPVCSPSRSSFMTGMYSITIGTQNHRSHRDGNFPLPEGVRVLTDWLRDAGYFTANLQGVPDGQGGVFGAGKTDWNFTYTGKPFDGNKWEELQGHQPFYSQINFHETHRKYNGEKKADRAKLEIPPYYPDHPVTREDWGQYLDAASELDRKVGLVLALLEKDGLADDTIVIFFGDNGQSHVRGKQFVYEEGLLVPLIVRWPKNFPVPEHFKPGTVDSRLLTTIDLAATTLDIAGVTKPEKMEGEVFLGERAAPPHEYVFGARDRCDETVFRLRTARDARYRYIRNFTPERPFLQKNNYKETSYPVWNLLKELNAQGKLTPVQAVLCAPTMPAEELYDLEQDPWEIENLAKSSEHQEVLTRMRAALERWIAKTGDKGAVLESPEVVAKETGNSAVGKAKKADRKAAKKGAGKGGAKEKKAGKGQKKQAAAK